MDLQKGFVPVVKLFMAGLIVLGALFIPIPRYQNGGCLEIDIDPPRCYSAGWKLGPSLWWYISGNSEKTVFYSTAPTPKPGPSNSASKNLCDYEYKSSFGPVVQIKDCGDYKILEYGCCDIPSLVLDRDNNEIMTCGGLKGWEKECQERFPLEASCAVAVCNPKTPPPDGCKKTGCNREICADKDMPSPCEALPKYGCYAKTKCERQADGNCGWTQTEELKECLNKYKN